jgi:hypothetical protein
VGGAAGAAISSKLADQSKAAAKDARVKSIVAQALGNPPDFNSVSLGTLIDQFVGMANADVAAKASEPRTDLMAQGAANGIAAGIGMGGGKPPAQSPSAVLVDGAGLAANKVSGTSVPDIAILSNGNDVKSGVPGSDFTPSADVTGPYVRPSGAGPNAAQKASVQGQPCVDCGTVTPSRWQTISTPWWCNTIGTEQSMCKRRVL